MASVTRAWFKTAKLNNFVGTSLVKATSAAAAKFRVGDLVTYDPATKAIAAATDPAVENAAIIAQSDLTLNTLNKNRSSAYKHVDVESKTLQYDGYVDFAAGQTKNVVIWKVLDATDVEIDTYDDSAPEQLV